MQNRRIGDIRFRTGRLTICRYCVTSLNSTHLSPIDALHQWRKEFRESVYHSRPDAGAWASGWIARNQNAILLESLRDSIYVRGSHALKIIRAYRAGLVCRRRQILNYPPNWSLKRFRLKSQSGFACTLCGAREKEGAILHAHHIVHRSHSGTNNDRNLVILCVAHHQQQHPGIVIGNNPERPQPAPPDTRSTVTASQPAPPKLPVPSTKPIPTTQTSVTAIALAPVLVSASPPSALTAAYAPSQPEDPILAPTPPSHATKTPWLPLAAAAAFIVVMFWLALSGIRAADTPDPELDPPAPQSTIAEPPRARAVQPSAASSLPTARTRLDMWKLAVIPWESRHARFLESPVRRQAMQSAIYAIDLETGHTLDAEHVLARAYARAAKQAGWPAYTP
ncbi:MAG TPA: HNH endonuclease [Rhodanobacteraceae bacterium]|nr:HNH endonuclease [Rhodanobacteraceae bacterium]